MMPGPQSRTDVIEHQEPKLTIKRTTTVSAGGTVTSEFVFAVDGQPHKNSTPQGDLTSTLKWDGPALVIVSTVPTPQGEVTLNDRYTLSEDGKTLTQVRTLGMQGQSMTQTMVLVKQP